MRALSLVMCLSLAACANDRYSVTTGDPVAMGPSLKACKKEALDRYFASQDQSGVLVAGAAFGAIGGLIYGAASKPKDDPNVYVEACMKQHGYEGTSEN